MAARLFERVEIRQTIQVAVAATLAITAGTLISGHRWYWALIAAFIVSIGVGSSGEALIKGLQRLSGTLAGVLVGIGLAVLLSGHVMLSAALALLFVFLAFYAFQVAYGTMIFFITLMLALLFSMIGQFSPELLWLRLEETAVGSVIGILATTLVLPVRQSKAFADELHVFLDALGDAISATSQDPEGGRDDDPNQRMQKAVQDLRNAVGAIKRGWLPLVDRRYLLVVRATMRCAYLAREAKSTRMLSSSAIDALGDRIVRLCALVDEERSYERPVNDDCGDDELVQALLDALDLLANRYAATKRQRAPRFRLAHR
jgi:uncharacterized membrane protein YccC